MSLLSVEGGTLDQLQTTEQVALLDTIDELRSQGLGHHGISLPQLIVCGDQSSGKSSLLEGLTRLRFPTDATCTTIFATEVVLRRGTTVEISVEITPSKHRSDKECRALATFKHTYSSCEEFNFHSLHAEARTNMAGGKSVEDGTFFDDVLRVKYSGPDMPSFTIVDLPGLILRDIKGGDGVRKVADLVTRYMEDEKAIILAVMSAGADMENQHTLNYLDQHDPTRQRTLGIITKPDTAPRGSKLERAYVDLAKNEKMPMKYHWHTVRNRNHEERAHSDTQRDEAETKFFQTEPWASLPRQHVGIAALRAKLSRVLLEHISMELPSLATAVQNAAQVTESSLKALGHTRDSSKEQRAYLTGHAERFQMLTNDALRGIYSNRFFALTTPDEQAPIRLRTVVQNLNLGFAHVMYENGHTWDVVSDEDFKTYGPSHRTFQHDATWSGEPVLISRADFLEKHIGNYVRQSRPSGLPSLVNPWVIGEVFRQQSRNWSNIAKTHLQQVFQAVRIYVEEALSSLVDPRTHNLLMLRQIQPELDKRWHNVEAKLEELLVPYTEQDPITYDPGFLSDLERMRALRYNLNDGEPKAARNPFTFDKKTLGNTTSNSSQRLLTESLDDFTNSEILDLMQTYYKSAISVFINNIAVLAIENCLIKDLSAIFSPTLTANMDDEQLHSIAAESEEVRYERDALRKKLEVLQSGKRILYEHIAMRPTARPLVPVKTNVTIPGGITEQAFQRTMNDSISRLNNLTVTPPPSGSNSRQPSRGRHDSVHGAPLPTGGAKKRSPPRWTLSAEALGPEMQTGSEEEL